MRLIDADAFWMDVIHSMDYCDDILEIIERQPTIEERKIGKWIPLGIRHGWVCSKCRKENVYAFATDGSSEYILQDYFCPNCGADMRG